MPMMLARRPMKRRRTVPRRRTPGYRNGVVSRTSQSANFRTGARALKPTAGLSSSVSSVFTATTSGVSALPGGGFQLYINQNNAGLTTWTIPEPAPVFSSSLCLSTTLNSVSFNLNGTLRTLTFTGASTFQGLYDFYRIDRVEILMYVGATWVADGTTSLAQSNHGAADFSTPVFVYAVDSNDSNSISQSQLLSYSNVQMKQCAVNSPIQMSYKPAAESQLGNVTNVQGTGPVFSPKIGTNTPSVPHFGVKMIPMGLSSTPTGDIAMSSAAFVVKQYVTFFDRRST